MSLSHWRRKMQDKTLAELAQLGYDLRDYRVRIVPEPTTDGYMVFAASVEELPGCQSQGDTVEEARENIADAFTIYVSQLLRRGVKVPPPPSPRAAVVRDAAWNVPTYPVQQSRITPEMHRLLLRRYDAEAKEQSNR